ncbi:hypothetical protein Btru_048309 [Bulinus truncatus]|nr:hypothetical protein Btru_048309 [Bulinus truncatus]
MDSIPLEMDDIFEDYEDAEDFYPARLPDLADELELKNDAEETEAGDDDNTDNPDLLSKLKSMKGASKNVARKSFPKLNAERLIGERGIPALPIIFKKVPLLGRNHEADDLKVIMRHLEHWGHRLFPKMPFAEVLERVERLGSKKEVQNCVKRIRLDLPVTNIVDDDDVQRGSQDDGDRNNIFDQLNNSTEVNATEPEDLPHDYSDPVISHITSQERVLTTPVVKDSTMQSEPLSQDLKAKIERNKMLALSKRAAKLKDTPLSTDNVIVSNKEKCTDILNQSRTSDDVLEVMDKSKNRDIFDDM